MNFAKMYAFIMLGFVLLLSRTDGDKLCSCYSFNNKSNGMAWPQALGSCNYNKKTLVVMETEREWEFIKNEIQNRVGRKYDEWFIGLELNFTTRNWTWVNGKPLTIEKWQGSNPEPNDFYGLIHKEFPVGYKGSFSTIKGSIQRGWICEEETDNCQGDCFFHIVPTSTSSPRTKAVTTRGKTSTEQDITDVSDAESAKPKKSGQKNGEEDQLGESQYESVNPVEAAKLLGPPNSTSYKNNTRFDPPPENCEYAVVNKANKKRKEGDLVYAQLADFVNETDAVKPPKLASYEPTIYADVEELPQELPERETVDSSQPTYANLETTDVLMK